MILDYTVLHIQYVQICRRAARCGLSPPAEAKNWIFGSTDIG